MADGEIHEDSWSDHDEEALRKVWLSDVFEQLPKGMNRRGPSSVDQG